MIFGADFPANTSTLLLFHFHINNRLVKIEYGMNPFEEFQTDIARCRKQRQVFGDDNHRIR